MASDRDQRQNQPAFPAPGIGYDQGVTSFHQMTAKRARYGTGAYKSYFHNQLFFGPPIAAAMPPEPMMLIVPMVAVSSGPGGGSRSISEARASACVSIYSRMFVSLPFRTVMAKTQWSSNVLFVALILPVAKPTTRTRSPCATNRGALGTKFPPFRKPSEANPPIPRARGACRPAASPGPE